MSLTTAQEELIKNAQFYPIFGPDGQIEGIQQLSVPTDRRLGVRAVEELMEGYEPGDEQLLANGFSQRQMRILNSPAPAAAHYLNPTKKYDAQTGEMVPAMTIIIPFEVSWRLFELLFPGQYSVKVDHMETAFEEEVTAQAEKGEKDDESKVDNAPGRIFYSRAQVTITLHLGDGQKRHYTGLGVGYNHIREGKLGNAYAINSAHRTVEKGAVTDAKREALTNVGRAFRRAFEDGDEMVQKFEELLMERLKEANKPARHARASEASPVAAPVPRKAGVVKKSDKADTEEESGKSKGKSKSDAKVSKKKSKKKAPKPDAPKKADPVQKDEAQPVDEIPYDEFDEPSQPEKIDTFTVAQQGKVMDQSDDPDIYFDRISDLLSACEDQEEAKRILDENSEDLSRAEKASKAGNTVAALREMAIESLDDEDDEDNLDEAEVDEDTAESVDADDAHNSQAKWKIEVAKPTGVAILDGYKKMFAQAKSKRDVEAILESNTDLAKRLTNAQKATLLNETVKAKKKAA